MTKHIFSTSIILTGLVIFIVGVGSFFLSEPTQAGISQFLVLLGGITALIGVRMVRSASFEKLVFAKIITIVCFFVFIGSTMLAIVTIFREAGIGIFLALFSIGCAILTAMIQLMIEQPAGA